MNRLIIDITPAILAGGLGTRLRRAIADRPKVLAPVGGRPFLTYLLDQLEEAGIGEVVLLTGYQGDMIRQAVGDSYRKIRLVYSPEPEPRGTAGALRHALPLLATPLILLVNGDSFCNVPLPDFMDHHFLHRAEISLVLASVADAARFGNVQFNSQGWIVDFEEKKKAQGPAWINAGIYLLSRNLLGEIPANAFVSLEQEMLPRWIKQGKKVQAFPHRGRFLDIGTPEAYAEAEGQLRIMNYPGKNAFQFMSGVCPR